MLSFLLSLIGKLVPTAYAQVKPGDGNQGVRDMWDMICETLPFCDVSPGQVAPFFAGRITAMVFSLIGGVAVILVIYAGIRMIYSQGQEDGLSKAKTIVTYALAGVVLALIGTSVMTYLIGVLQQLLA